MFPVLFTILAMYTLPPPEMKMIEEPPKRIIQGTAAHYSKGLFERVSRNRDLPVVDCMIASPFHQIGEWVIVRGLKTETTRRCRVTDTSQPRDKPRHIKSKSFDLDYESAKEICGSVTEPRRACPIEVIDVEDI